ncbi:MAG: cytochrome c oxidase subunit 3 [Rhodobacteraceae bacterium]|nr:cytochrome c oxidase subunit 3 [Paracoccaceae bacterium]
MLNPSLWPLLGAVAAFVMLFGATVAMKGETTILGGMITISGPWMGLIGFVGVLYVMFGWWADTVAENKVGDHTPVVLIGLRYGFILFIMSEVMFFSAWFWSFFKHAMYPMGEMSPMVDGVWPPVGIETFDPWHLPLINTLILLCSGAAATWAHHAIAHEGNRKDMMFICMLRAMRGHFSPEQHLGFEAAAWYWHFVDVVWLFLFAAVYVWGG